MTGIKGEKLFRLIRERAKEIIDEKSLRRALSSGKKLRVKLGVDPTAPGLHIGHVVTLHILRAFQDAGHTAVLIIGDFTGQIGDPSNRAAGRRQLTPRDVRDNEKTYRAQVKPILNLATIETRHNSEWFGKMNAHDFLALLTNFSLKSAVEREDFKKRTAAGGEVRLHEALYHVLQAYDSVMVRSDIELGGLDQRLNILAGRELQRKLGVRPQDIILMPYLIGLDGREKMSKTVGNTINLSDGARDMLGKAMSIPDSLIGDYARLAAWMPEDAAVRAEKRLHRGENPRDVKLDVAEAITALYHGGKKAHAARTDFVETFSLKSASAGLPKVWISEEAHTPIELVLMTRVTSSKSEARRLLKGRAVEIDGNVAPVSGTIRVRDGSVLRVGKKHFFQLSRK